MPSNLSLTAVTALCVTAAGVTAARADPFDPGRVPADARYVLHVDMDALRPTQLWDAVDDRLSGNEAFGAKMGLFEQASGMHFPRDLHDVTVYGTAAGDAAAVVLIHGNMKRDQMMASLPFAPGYAAEQFGTYDGASWTDDNRPMFGVFHDASTFVIARSADKVRAALDTLDAKAKPLAATEPLAAGARGPATRPTLMYVAAVDPAGLTGGKADQLPPLARQVQSAWVAVSERPAGPATRPTDPPAANDAVVSVSTTTTTADGADQLVSAAGGVRALMGLASMSNKADANTKFAAAVLRKMTVTQAGKTVSATVSAPVDQVTAAIDRAADKAKARREAADK